MSTLRINEKNLINLTTINIIDFAYNINFRNNPHKNHTYYKTYHLNFQHWLLWLLKF